MNIILKTERLYLRPISEDDFENVHHLQSLEETAKYNTSKIPENINETKATVRDWILKNNQEKPNKFTFAIDLADDEKFIGLIGINLGKEHYKNAEVWFQFDYRFWNKGYATESLRKIIDFGFEDLKLHRIEAGCAVDNVGSVSALEKVGMLREAHTRQLLPLKSGWSDNYGYAILETDLRK